MEPPNSPTRVIEVFLAADTSVRNGALIHRASPKDKEFHFQDWFRERLAGLAIAYDPPARNSYPDFRLVELAEGYEVKGLAYPGRKATYDNNSQVPTGFHNGRNVYYFFGRYPSEPGSDDYPVIDFVLCHGDFLNADHTYVHLNESIRGFGSDGDIMIRDRRMFVAPTPFALTQGTTAQRTLILPAGMPQDPRLDPVGNLERVEWPHLMVGYTFDLRSNTLTPEYDDNPRAGTTHHFTAYRAKGTSGPEVTMRANAPDILETDDA